MNKRTSVVNISGDHEETLIQLARHLGTNKIRRDIFNAIYGRGKRPRSKKELMEAAGIASNGTNPQQAQNELDHLSKHHLIIKIENNGQVDDGSRFVYAKDETVRANKKRIANLADNPNLAAKLPTKRRPVVQGVTVIKQITKRELKRRNHLTVLYLSANPELSSPLRVEAEMRKVREAIRGSKFRDNISVEYRPAADLNSLIEGLNDYRPQIVHFSGHGNEDGIATDTGSVSKPATAVLSFDLLAKALAATDSPPEIIVLNSCKSSAARKYLLPTAKVIITMRVSVSDTAAAAFARNFYAAIASGQSIKAAFDQGGVAVEAVSLGESDTPELLCRPGINPAKIILT